MHKDNHTNSLVAKALLFIVLHTRVILSKTPRAYLISPIILTLIKSRVVIPYIRNKGGCRFQNRGLPENKRIPENKAARKTPGRFVIFCNFSFPFRGWRFSSPFHPFQVRHRDEHDLLLS